MSIDEPPPYAIVMKGGVHASEGWEEIVERKRAEERSAGVILWGYGGTVCHPMTQVQPFAEDAEGAVAVLMIRTPSDFLGAATLATAMSVDGWAWEPIPPGVAVVGSRFALTIQGFEQVDEQLDLGAYVVGIGPRRGQPLASYLRGRVDKACACLGDQGGSGWIAPVIARASLVPPYAVMLRN